VIEVWNAKRCGKKKETPTGHGRNLVGRVDYGGALVRMGCVPYRYAELLPGLGTNT